MGTQVKLLALQLSKLLQDAHHNFAYHMLALEVQLSTKQQQINGNRCSDIVELTQLYTKALEVLEGKSDNGFQFFNTKIKELMKKRSVVQQLFKSVNCSSQKKETTMKVVVQAEASERKQQYNLRKRLHKGKYDQIKIQQMIKNAQLKINMMESQMKTDILFQEERLAQRIQHRRMKSLSSITCQTHQIHQEFKQIKTAQHENVEEHFKSKSFYKKMNKKSKSNLYHSFTQII